MTTIGLNSNYNQLSNNFRIRTTDKSISFS
nr:MAG TPA: hypothetical protein [Herelleviridae sp.]